MRAIGLLILMFALMCADSAAAARIAYVDASFGNCKVPQWCNVVRVETQLHALAAIGRDPLVTRVTPGAMAARLADDAIGLIDDWEEEGGIDAGSDHLIFGFGNDFWDGDGQEIIDQLRRVEAEYQSRSPRTTLWVLDYPPADGAPPWVQERLAAVGYEGFRAQYRAEAKKMGLTIIRAYDDWLASGAWHPNLPGPDYHLSQHSAVDAALRIYLAIRTVEQRRLAATL